MIGSLLYDLNHASIWRRELTVWDQRVRAASLDRLVFLGLHRVGLMGKEEARLLKKLIGPGMQILDVGANIGLYTLLLAGLAGPSGRVFAFEPEPNLFSVLCENCAANGVLNVSPFQCAAGEANGRATFQRATFNSGDNRLGPARGDAQPIEVEVVRLDDVVGVRPVHFIKLDVQGHELAALSGMPELLSANPDLRVLFEFWPAGLEAAKARPEKLLEFFLDRDFEIYETNEGRLERMRPPSQLLAGMKSKQYINLLAARGSLGANLTSRSQTGTD
jgi:FkbM family methyltransferase